MVFLLRFCFTQTLVSGYYFAPGFYPDGDATTYGNS